MILNRIISFSSSIFSQQIVNIKSTPNLPVSIAYFYQHETRMPLLSCLTLISGCNILYIIL
jgi:hypothetical protein